MIRFLRSALHPAAYHGHGKKPPFFEGWYYKIVDATEEQRFAIIPGVFLSDDPDRHHAFVQVLDCLLAWSDARYERTVLLHIFRHLNRIEH